MNHCIYLRSTGIKTFEASVSSLNYCSVSSTCMDQFFFLAVQFHLAIMKERYQFLNKLFYSTGVTLYLGGQCFPGTPVSETAKKTAKESKQHNGLRSSVSISL